MDDIKKILVLEDEAGIRSFVVINLRRTGYEPIEAATGEEALRLLAENDDIGVALLDVMLPDIDGFEICRSIRASGSKMGIIMLTALGQEMDKVTGLMTGADDYVTKPFSPAELLARVENILRRAQKERTRFVFDALTVDLPSRRVTKDGREVALTALEFDLLAMLVRRNNVALSREALLAGVWGYAYQGETRTVDVHIQRLRGKIGAEYIETVYKYGYRFCGKEVERR